MAFEPEEEMLLLADSKGESKQAKKTRSECEEKTGA
jgi:hypothetical protein